MWPVACCGRQVRTWTTRRCSTCGDSLSTAMQHAPVPAAPRSCFLALDYTSTAHSTPSHATLALRVQHIRTWPHLGSEFHQVQAQTARDTGPSCRHAHNPHQTSKTLCFPLRYIFSGTLQTRAFTITLTLTPDPSPLLPAPHLGQLLHGGLEVHVLGAVQLLTGVCGRGRARGVARPGGGAPHACACVVSTFVRAETELRQTPCPK